MIGKIKNFFQEVKIEAKKANYPKKDEVIASTWVVIVTVVIISFFLGLFDFVLSRFISAFFVCWNGKTVVCNSYNVRV